MNATPTLPRPARFAAFAMLALLAAASGVAQTQAGPDASMQSSSVQGVTVQVTPRPPAGGAGRWEFAIVLDTHSAELRDDLMQSATLSTDDGRTIKPLEWAGAPPGGHHRSGLLSFELPPPRPKAVELRIARPGEAAPRAFRWQP